MKDRRIQQLGTPDEVYNRPGTPYVAQFIGNPSMNVLRGRFADDAVSANAFRLPMKGCDFVVPPAGAWDAWLGIRPEHVLTGRAVEHALARLEVAGDLVEPMPPISQD